MEAFPVPQQSVWIHKRPVCRVQEEALGIIGKGDLADVYVCGLDHAQTVGGANEFHAIDPSIARIKHKNANVAVTSRVNVDVANHECRGRVLNPNTRRGCGVDLPSLNHVWAAKGPAATHYAVRCVKPPIAID